jgi:spore coat polysaccharide biosynthesis protein SpsF
MILGILQARMSSTRLPGKVLEPILGRPMLARQIERLGRSRRLERLVVATSQAADDDPIAGLCKELGLECARGSLEDVLDRFYQAALPFGPGHVVRLTGDCPLADWRLLDDIVDFAIKGGFDYASNTLKPTWPDGLDVEVVTFAALAEAWREAALGSEREHVTPFIHKRPDRFRLGSFEGARDLSTLRWTVDEPADLAFVRAIYERLYPGNPSFATEAILALLEQAPEIGALNARFLRNEGYLKSLAADGDRLK